jgi:glycine betaine/proline transport system substrate-binding protein
VEKIQDKGGTKMEKKKLSIGFVMLFAAVFFSSAIIPSFLYKEGKAFASEKKTINIGWVAWIENEAVKEVAKQILEKEFNYNVETKLADLGVLAEGLKNGSIDVFLELCRPATHKDYWERIRDEVIAAGMFYDQLVQGWVIPEYVPKSELDSIMDMKKPDVKRKLDGKVIGIEAGAGLMRQSKMALEHYGLSGYELVTSSEPAMLASLGKAIKKKEWVIVLLWKPHFAWAQWDLRLMKDPDQVLGKFDSCHIFTHKTFMSKFPDAYAFFARFYWGIPLIGEILYDIGVEKMTVEKAAEKFIKEHPERVRYWVTGKID